MFNEDDLSEYVGGLEDEVIESLLCEVLVEALEAIPGLVTKLPLAFDFNNPAIDRVATFSNVQDRGRS